MLLTEVNENQRLPMTHKVISQEEQIERDYYDLVGQWNTHCSQGRDTTRRHWTTMCPGVNQPSTD